MTTLAVDTSTLLAIFKGEASGQPWLDCLQTAAETSALVASSMVLAEVRSLFPSDESCRKRLRDLGIRNNALTEETTLLAGEIFRIYRNEGGPRKAILPDFLIAAHAAMQADALVTADRGYLRRYFPAIRLVTPQSPL